MAFVNMYLQYSENELELLCTYVLCDDCAGDFCDLEFDGPAADDDPCEECGVTNEEHEHES